MRIKDYCVVDLEMTGLTAKTDRVIEAGAVRVRDGRVVAEFNELCNPGRAIPDKVQQLTGITEDMVQHAPTDDEVLGRLVEFIGADVVVGHNFSFDYRFLVQWAANHKQKLSFAICDTLKIARAILPENQPKNLEALCAHFAIPREHAHRATDDARETGEVFERLKELADDTQDALFAPKQLQMKAKKQTPATAHQLQRLREYRELHGITDDIRWEGLTRSEASRLMDHYFSTFGR